ncbi:MAG: cystathionine beta-lyase [Deltaproteobacteria bacterium]|nr:cystathionine beta-lyase [Deltaproteobacteria bacterium]
MKDETRLVHLSQQPERHQGILNPPVYHASTIVYDSLADFRQRLDRKYDGIMYGALGTPTTFALSDAVAALEGGEGSVATSSGLAAVSLGLLSFLGAGDHLLMVDSVYHPTRTFCDGILKRMGVETTYYDPLLGEEGITGLLRENTRVVFAESPGSGTFEMQDIPALASAAHRGGALLLLDNTWGTPLFFKPFTHGVDVSIQAGTKYIAGHSDLVIGHITCRSRELFRRVKDCVGEMGDIPGPDDCYLALRGLRTMAVRMARHQESGLRIARWLAARPEVKRVLYPALPDDPGYGIWKRDFTGAASLFSVVLHETREEVVEKLIGNLRLFRLGASWGGYESLVLPVYGTRSRTTTRWDEPGFVLRFHIGLEDPGDLEEDLERGLNAL